MEPVSKLNVFDRRPAKRGIEAAVSTEHSSPYSAESTPERLRNPARSLVDKVMHQISILRQEVLLRWSVIVRSERSRKIRFGCKELYNARQAVRFDTDI